MKKLAILAILLIAAPGFMPAAPGDSVTVPADISHELFDQLLKKHVDEQGLVAYGAWKENPQDLQALDNYLSQFEPNPRQPAAGDDKSAALVNLYNALTIRWILQNFPTDSIQALSDSFGAKRHQAGGQKVSLDDIEHATLIPMIGHRAHAVLVCAARSCPPLQRDAFTAGKLDAQVDDAFRDWLAREDLNKFEPKANTARISSIFKWFAEDFEKAGGIRKVLLQHGPKGEVSFLENGGGTIEHLPYNWGLNDQAGKGQNYSRARMIWDRILDFLMFWR